MNMLIHSRHLNLSDSQKESIKLLKSVFRNGFEHFKPKGWSIEVHGMPQIAIDILEVVKFLALQTNTYVHLSDTEEKLIKHQTEDSIEFIKNSELYAELLLAKEIYEKESSDNKRLQGAAEKPRRPKPLR